MYLRYPAIQLVINTECAAASDIEPLHTIECNLFSKASFLLALQVVNLGCGNKFLIEVGLPPTSKGIK